MFKLKLISGCFAVLMMLFASSVSATAQTDFEQGLKLFKAGDYSEAVEKFESARKQGMKTVSLYYNLGSSYFKLENYRVSKHYFSLVAKLPEMQSLAEYNLGLIALREKQNKLASDYFNRVITAGKDQKLVALSRKKLREIRQIKSPWSAFISMNLGHDDNITASPSGAVSNISDNFYDFYASIDRVVSGKRKAGWLVDASYFRMDYSDSDYFDEYMIQLGIRKEHKLADWDSRFKFSMSKRNYGGNDFQTILQLGVVGKKSLSKSDRILIRFRYEDISSDYALYDYLEGSRIRLRTEYRSYDKYNDHQFYYEIDINDRGVLDAGSYSYEYSPSRHTVLYKYTYLKNDKWHYSGEASYRVSDFPASTSFDRNDDRLKLALGADYRFDKTFKLRTRLQYIDNASTVDIYDYDKTMVTIGLSKLF